MLFSRSRHILQRSAGRALQAAPVLRPGQQRGGVCSDLQCSSCLQAGRCGADDDDEEII